MKTQKTIALLLVAILVPEICLAQGGAQMGGLHGVLDQLYQDMMPLCSRLIGAGRAIAGFAAIWYIGSRVWRHIAAAEPVDFYPLMRPFVLGFAILIFPSVLGLINSVLSPVVGATASMVQGSNSAIAVLLAEREKAIRQTNAWQMYVGITGEGDRERWFKYTFGVESSSGEGMLDGIGNDIRFAMDKMGYQFRNSVKEWMAEILRVLFEAAALCINAIRTFHLVVLAIVGPIALGISVFDGFQHTLTGWAARYMNVYLWLPVANIFGAIIGKIQEKMIALDIRQVEGTGDTFFSATDMGYLIFLIIGIVGYFSVPSVAGYIIHAGGGNALLYRTTRMFSTMSDNLAGKLSANAMPGFGNRTGR